MTNKTERTALDAFLEHKARIDEALGYLQTKSGEHFDTHPDEVNWADAGSLEHIAELLEPAVSFNEGTA